MKYTYTLGPAQLHAEFEESQEEGLSPAVAYSSLQVIEAEINLSMQNAIIDELYQAFAKETNSVVVNDGDIVLNAGAFNAVLASMANKYTKWLQGNGLVPLADITKN